MVLLWIRETITDDNYSPVVNIVTWILMVSMVLSVCTKVAMKLLAHRSFDADDALLTAAMVFSAAQSLAFSLQTNHGVGRHYDSFSVSQINGYEKAGYSADILYITALLISKTSVLVLLRQITPVETHRRLILIAGALIVSWTVASLFAVAFQCRSPEPWKILGSRCFNRVSFWTSYGVINIISEAILISLPAYTFWKVQMPMQQKVVVVACFAIRVIVIGAVIAQLVLLGQHRRSQDITFDNWSYYLSTQFVQNLGVITACVPYIKNALLGLESGMFQTGHFHLATLRKELRKPPQSESSGTTSGNGTTVRGSEQHGDRSHHHMPHSVAADIIPRLTPWYGRNTATAEPVTPTEEWDVESHCSGARIIKQTREVLVARE